ncbi:Hypothetical predicted protein [Paramuricea clavata]|uniref:Uncharacterized protein n=1 Tax=Paramuricea clavata TaxID=317549 RepID=A0A7D9HYL6_PARCT|nr:Hypothetical predicted protein [Paramuricea clavata]
MKLTGRKVNIQSLVKSPSLYIVARPSFSDADQLCYIDTRLECLEKLCSEVVTTASGEPLIDKMRFFHGHSPSRQYEASQQKGGSYHCAVCGANAHRAYELDYVFRCPHMSLGDRQRLVLKGPCGKVNSLPLSKIKETFHGLTKLFDGDKKKELEDLLKMELHGVQRVPA